MTNEKKRKLPRCLLPLLRLAQGVLIGAGAILPGVSGGAMSVAFDIYRPLMAVIARPVAAVKKYWPVLLPAGLGWALGFWFFAGAIEHMMAWSEAASVWLFIGLIGGTLPGLYSKTAGQGSARGGWLWALGGALLFAALIFILRHAAFGQPAATPGWFYVCGVLWGFSLVIPGFTMASVTIALGLYQPMTAGIAALDLGVMLPMGAGIATIALILGRVMDHLLTRWRAQSSRAVLGFVAASTAAIIPLHYASVTEAALSAALAGGGFLLAWWMERSSPPVE